ncbi:MAG: hypothetical protein ABIB97_01100 [Patescibacteria group bacterium]
MPDKEGSSSPVRRKPTPEEARQRRANFARIVRGARDLPKVMAAIDDAIKRARDPNRFHRGRRYRASGGGGPRMMLKQ